FVAATRGRPQRARHRTARHDHHLASHQGRRRDPSRYRDDVMITATTFHASVEAASGLEATQDPNAIKRAKAKAASEKFEAMFLNSMFRQMFTGVDGDGPFGGSG